MKHAMFTVRYAIGAAMALGLSASVMAVDINGGTSWGGWTDHGKSVDTGRYARGGKVQDYQIYTTVFIYNPANPIAGTSSGFVAGNKILGIGIKFNSTPTGSPVIKLDPNNNSYYPSPDGSVPGQSSFSSNGDLGDSTVHFPGANGEPSEITIRSANPYVSTNDYYLPNGGYWGGGGQPGFRGMKSAPGCWQLFFDLDQMTAEFGPGGTRTIIGKPTLGAFGTTITFATGGLGGTEAVVREISTVTAPPVPQLTAAGFQPPLDRPVVVKKANRVLPLRMKLLDANGAIVSNVAPPVVQVDYVGAHVYGAGELQELASAGQGSEGNAFVWNGEYWAFNLSTKGLAPGTYTIYAVSGNVLEYVINPTCSVQVQIE